MMSFIISREIRLVFTACCALSVGGCAGDDQDLSPLPWRSQARQAHSVAAPNSAPRREPPPADRRGINLVGHEDFGGRGNFGDVWVQGNYAYVGSFRAQGCPGHGVSVADVSNPAHPTAVSTFAAYPNTAAEEITATFMASPHFVGTVAAVGLQDCSETPGVAGQHGLALWNVTNPHRPTPLGVYDTGAATLGGVHELSLFQRDGRYYAILATNFYGVDNPDVPESDVRIIEITNPRAPRFISSWAVGRDLGLAYGSPLLATTAPHNCDPPPGGTSDCRAVSSGGYPAVYAHSVSVSQDTNRAYVSYWDAGMFILDIRKLSRPVLLGRGNSDATEEGDLHSAIEVPYFNGDIAITTDEDFSPEYNVERERGDIWGFARIWKISNPAHPVQIATIDTPHSASNRNDGLYAVHNPATFRNYAFFTWYTDGLRVYDIANPRRPELVAYFDAPRVPDPAPGSIHIPAGAFWGLALRFPYVYVSDMNAGLYVLRLAPKALENLR
jgi:hypothetical protein